MGPKPTKPLGVIVKFKEGVVGIAAAGTGTARRGVSTQSSTFTS